MDEQAFQAWYKGWAAKLGLDPNPDAKEHYYDWRGAYKEGATPDAEKHWPSKFKLEGHPNLIVNGQDTRTGKPVMATPPQDGMDAGGGGSLGQLIQGPQGFVQGPPPANESEFQQNFNEMRTFLKDPAIRSALGQFAIAMFQPRAPGQTLLGHTGQAAGQAGMAANRVMTQEEELRKTQTKEMENQQQLEQAQQRIALGEKELGQKAEFHKDDVRLREKQIAVSEANSRRLAGAEAARIAAEDRRLNRETDLRAIDAATKAETERMKRAEERLNALDPSKPEYAAAKTEAQFNPENVSRYYNAMRSAINPGARAAAEKLERETSEARKNAPAFTDEQFNAGLADIKSMEGLAAEYKAGRRKFTPEQERRFRAEVAARNPTTASVITEDDSVVTAMEKTVPGYKGARELGGRLMKDVGIDPKGAFGARLEEATKGYTYESLMRADDAKYNRVMKSVQDILPPKGEMPHKRRDWEFILNNDIATRVAEARYGDAAVARARLDLKRLGTTRKDERDRDNTEERKRLRLKVNDPKVND